MIEGEILLHRNCVQFACILNIFDIERKMFDGFNSKLNFAPDRVIWFPFKYLEYLVTNEISIQDGIKCTLKAGNHHHQL